MPAIRPHYSKRWSGRCLNRFSSSAGGRRHTLRACRGRPSPHKRWPSINKFVALPINQPALPFSIMPIPVSVIMTVFNGERYLQAAIDSICAQSLPDFEFIIVNDGSTDTTSDILAAAAADDRRIRVIPRERYGRVAALNCAWQQAQGEYIANLDADDLAHADRLRQQLDYMRAHPGVGVLGTAVRVVDERDGRIGVRRHPSRDSEIRRQLVRRNCFVHSSVMLSRAHLVRVDGYDARFRKSHDYDLYVRMAAQCRLANLPETLTVKRKHNHASFSPSAYHWYHARDHIRIRYRAWRTLGHTPSDLTHVFLEPLARWLYLQIKHAGR